MSKTTTRGSTAAADAKAAGKAASTATSTAPADPQATATLQQPEPTASAMTKQLGARYPAKDSNEGQTGVTSYTVQPGHNITARGRQYAEGEQVPLNHVDAARLIESGHVAASGANRDDHPLAHHLDDNAPEVIAMLEQDGLTAGDLAELFTLETGGKARKTVLEAIEAAQQRANGE